MDEVVTQLLTYQTAIVMIVSVIVTYVIRKSVEILVPGLKKAADEMSPGQTYLSHAAAWWNEVGLHLVPVAIGVGLVFAVSALVPPDIAAKGTGSVAIYGGISGWFSSTGYKILRRIAKTRTGVDLPSLGESVPPPPPEKPADTPPVTKPAETKPEEPKS